MGIEGPRADDLVQNLRDPIHVLLPPAERQYPDPACDQSLRCIVPSHPFIATQADASEIDPNLHPILFGIAEDL